MTDNVCEMLQAYHSVPEPLKPLFREQLRWIGSDSEADELVFDAEAVPQDLYDGLLALGWRHFGSHFFFRRREPSQAEVCEVRCVRVEVERWQMRRDDRRMIKKNQDLAVRIVPPDASSEEHYDLLAAHQRRFGDYTPRLADIIHPTNPAIAPVPSLCLECRLEGQLVAFSYITVGRTSSSSLYAAWHPALAERRLGFFTLARELALVRQMGIRYHYLGYAGLTPNSINHYKRCVHGAQELLGDFCWASVNIQR